LLTVVTSLVAPSGLPLRPPSGLHCPTGHLPVLQGPGFASLAGFLHLLSLPELRGCQGRHRSRPPWPPAAFSHPSALRAQVWSFCLIVLTVPRATSHGLLSRIRGTERDLSEPLFRDENRSLLWIEFLKVKEDAHSTETVCFRVLTVPPLHTTCTCTYSTHIYCMRVHTTHHTRTHMPCHTRTH
jgi:hypothetical protein